MTTRLLYPHVTCRPELEMMSHDFPEMPARTHYLPGCPSRRNPLAAHSQHNLQGLLLDVATWADEGLVDAAVPAGYYAANSGGTPELAYEYLKKLTGGKIDIWTYAWVPTTVDEFRSGLEIACKLGAKQILYWEADYIDNNPRKTELQKVMSDHAASPPRR